MKIEDFLTECQSNVLIGIYKGGAENPEEEIKVSELASRDECEKLAKELTEKYGELVVNGFWCYNENTIVTQFSICKDENT